MSQIGPLGDVGPAIVTWDDQVITSIMDGATFRFVMGTTDVKEAEHGITPVDAVITGFEQCEFECPFTRMTYTNLAKLIPGSSRSGEAASGAVQAYSNRVGTTLYALSKELIVKRIVNGIADTDTTKWLHIFKTYPIPKFDIPYNVDGQRGFMVGFKSFPDSSNSNRHWRVGGAIA